MDESGQSGEKALRVEGHGCVFGGQVVFGYPPRNRDAGAIQGVHKSINDFRLRRLTSVFIAGWPLWVRAA